MVIPYKIEEYLSENKVAIDAILETRGYKNAYFDFRHNLTFLNKKHKHKTEVDFSPMIVPPTWLKSEHHSSLGNVWRNAANELHDARNIFIAGYSLPETDTFFRHLFALGTISPSKIQRFWVFNPDRRIATFDRFAKIVGTDVRNRFRYYEWKFDQLAHSVQYLLDPVNMDGAKYHKIAKAEDIFS